MLVLNTNQSGGWWYSLSNKDVSVSYPQIDNNILLHPLMYWYTLHSQLPTAFTVNWTVVHAICSTLNYPNDLECKVPFSFSSGSIAYPPLDGIYYVNTPTSTVFRFWIQEPLKAWMIIWKTIVFPPCYEVWYSWQNYCIWFIYKVWLLHSDWSITYLATVSRNAAVWSSIWKWESTFWSTWVDMYSPWKTCKVETTVWFQTVEWDRIIAEIYPSSQTNWWNFLSFWCNTPTMSVHLKLPIQVSID